MNRQTYFFQPLFQTNRFFSDTFFSKTIYDTITELTHRPILFSDKRIERQIDRSILCRQTDTLNKTLSSQFQNRSADLKTSCNRLSLHTTWTQNGPFYLVQCIVKRKKPAFNFSVHLSSTFHHPINY